MRKSFWTARRKLLVSLAVLSLVLVIAAIAQFTDMRRDPSPYASSTASAPLDPPPGGRAVFGEEPRPSPTAESAIPGPAVEDSTRARTETSSIDDFLTRWQNTVARGDLKGQTDLYAARLDRYFRQRNVSHAAITKDKLQMMSRYPTVNRYEISDVKIESNDGMLAVVSFRKEWDMNGQRRFSGAERQRLKLRRNDGDWQIFSEEETKVYWVKRG